MLNTILSSPQTTNITPAKIIWESYIALHDQFVAVVNSQPNLADNDNFFNELVKLKNIYDKFDASSKNKGRPDCLLLLEVIKQLASLIDIANIAVINESTKKEAIMFDLENNMFDLETSFSGVEIKTKQIEVLLQIWQESYGKECDESYAISALQDLVFGLLKETETMETQIKKIKGQKKPKIENNEINISKIKLKDLLDKSEHLEALMIPVSKAVTDEANTDTATLTNLASSLANDIAQEIRILEGA
ncbi:hypothetical protein [Photorhabdus aegyptia]|uniref:hypothetical protein n=1 Tax=Photorhabdus TaxID=29487 RepID=UPI001E3840E8|nr:hypothetical protein [Photorhabdus aegyptia]MCC8456211.1 hypothetical protein [Photorhabdus aegyptia]